ncbi:MAG: KilA-N domain-containing protein [Bacteroidetes bacterium]|nr:KilA-N domain-containing protein [Bacteroidota bacterium]
MAKKNITITVQGRDITITQIDDKDYISLSDMARDDGGHDRIKNWMRNRDTIEFLTIWEQIHNPNFNTVQMHRITEDAGLNRFTISPKQWIEETGAIGLLSKAGRYGGVYGHKDIAYNFGMWLSPKFSLLVITEFDRLKREEYSRQKLEWSYQRYLTKVNYRLHTDTIKKHIIPRIQAQQKGTPDGLVYADEADLLNMAVFGTTARQWREENPDQAKEGNIRDYADIAQLNVLANLESLNATLIERGMDKETRFEILAQTALSQYRRLVEEYQVKQIRD